MVRAVAIMAHWSVVDVPGRGEGGRHESDVISPSAYLRPYILHDFFLYTAFLDMYGQEGVEEGRRKNKRGRGIMLGNQVTVPVEHELVDLVAMEYQG